MNGKQIVLRNAIIDVIQDTRDPMKMFALIKTAAQVLKSSNGLMWLQIHETIDEAYQINELNTKRLERLP